MGESQASTGLWIGLMRTDASSVNNYQWFDGYPINDPQQYFCSNEPQNSEYNAAFWTNTNCLEDFSYNWYGWRQKFNEDVN